MILNVMDNELIDIYNIRNLESVKIYDFVLNSSPRLLVVPAIIITYDGGKTINMCSKEKYFDVLVKKVTEVYNDEKNNVIEDKISDPFRLNSTIAIDNDTKRILESGILSNIDDIYSFYLDKDIYSSSLLFNIDELKLIFPIIKYHIEELFSFIDSTIIFEQNFEGYRDRYIVSANIDGMIRELPFLYQRVDDNHYKISMAGLIEKCRAIDIDVIFKKEGIDISIDSMDGSLVALTNYKITNGSVKHIVNIKRNGLLVNYKNEDLNSCDCKYDNLAKIDSNPNLSWYKLPWNSYYGVHTKIDEISEAERIIELHNLYLGICDSSFIKKEFYSKVYKRNKTASVDANEVVLDKVYKTVIGMPNINKRQLYIVETLFDEDSINKISSEDSGRYFYHACLSGNGLKGISRSNLVGLSKKESFTNSCDILNRTKLINYIKGE